MAVLPISLALIICDHVWRDPITGKLTILGTFADLLVTELPAVVPQLTVYMALTDAHGTVPIKIQLIDSAEAIEEPIGVSELELEFDTLLATIEAVAVLNDVSFPSEGEYRLQIYVREQLLIERRIVVNVYRE